MNYRLGIDLGGTKIEIIVLDEQGQSVFNQRIATPKGDYQATLDAIVALVELAENFLKKHVLEGSLHTSSIGIGIPGSISAKTGLVRNANSVVLIGKDLKADLEEKLYRPVFIDNDANCFALSEAVDGAAQDYKSVFGVIIGTGCGGALVVNKSIIQGSNGIAGEWGHNPLPWLNYDAESTGRSFKNLSCYCGLSGCQETFLSGSGIERHFLERTGQTLSARQIVELSRQNHHEAKQLMQDYYVWLAKGLASIINIFDPDAIVLGGGLSNVDEIYQEVPAIWDQWIFNNENVNTILTRPKFGDSSGVRGAAWLATS
ncbi:ROK family protein [Thiomicrorhabdus indica]|uniref:ROK family protein n=1 Tax=Thiomicrorhabdus indica TaxID=2267253 RepID=UPI00102D9FD7|nr:ROK family protein [Thiomicrorhabdus indica]